MSKRAIHSELSVALGKRLGRRVFVEPERSAIRRATTFIPFCADCNRTLCNPEHDVEVTDRVFEDSDDEVVKAHVVGRLADVTKVCGCAGGTC